MTSAARATRLPSLDGLRAISILMVVVGHTFKTLPADIADHPWYVFRVLGQGPKGVSVFFVISGFLITKLLLAEQDHTGSISLPRFYARRALRILPAYYTFLLALAILAAAGAVMIPALSMLAAASFTWNYWHVPGTWWLGHVWSLCVEEQFYLTWPFLLAGLGARRCGWLAAGVIALSPLLRVGSYLLMPGSRPYLGIMLHTRADMLMLGCLAAITAGDPRVRRWLASAYRLGVHWWLVGIAFVASPALEQLYRGAYTLSIGYSIDGAAVALLLLYVVEHPESVAGRLLRWRPLARIGVLSYSIYLWQQLFCAVDNSTVLGRVPLNLLATFVAAELSYRFVESPFLRLKDRWAGRAGVAGPIR